MNNHRFRRPHTSFTSPGRDFSFCLHAKVFSPENTRSLLYISNSRTNDRAVFSALIRARPVRRSKRFPMNYANIKYCDISNGPGVRTSLFVSGCTHRCPGCFNEVAWDFAYGAPFTKEVRNQIFASCQPDLHRGAVPAGRRADGARQPAGAAALRPQLQGAVPGQNGLVLLGLHPRTAAGGRSPPAAGAKPPTPCCPCWTSWWTDLLYRRSTTSPCASGAAPTSGCWICPAPLPPATPSSAGRTRLFHPHHGLTYFSEEK